MVRSVKTVTEQIYLEIRSEILTSRLHAGEKLTIKKLHERYGVSSSPIREALTRLQQDGLIEYTPNIGMKVIQLTKEDLDEIFDLTTEFDILAMRFAFRNGDRSKILQELTEIQEKTAAYSADDHTWNELSDDFHLVFYKYANNHRLASAASNLRLQFTILSNEYEKIPENKEEIQAQHQEILDFLSNNNIDGAELAMRKHLTSSHEKAIEAWNSMEN